MRQLIKHILPLAPIVENREADARTLATKAPMGMRLHALTNKLGRVVVRLGVGEKKPVACLQRLAIAEKENDLTRRAVFLKCDVNFL